MASFYTRQSSQSFHRKIFVWPWKMVSANVRHLFYQPVDKKIKTWTLCFSVKENPNMEKALFDWPILLQHDVKAKYRLISSSRAWNFSPERLTNQKPSASLSVRYTNQIALIPFACCFCFVRAFSFQSHKKIVLWRWKTETEGTIIDWLSTNENIFFLLTENTITHFTWLGLFLAYQTLRNVTPWVYLFRLTNKTTWLESLTSGAKSAVYLFR